MRELIVDSFAGGGGASTGIEMALGRSPDIAINHDAMALAMHAMNHPETLHVPHNVWKVDPVSVTAGRPVGLLWASPDCKHFSKAKGGKPVKRNIRDLAWVVVRWAKQVRPRIIILENVEEFRSWGPIDAAGQPCKERVGQTFTAWVGELRRLGYKVEHRELRACDYGAPTIRKRLFLIARRDGEPIVWPKPTHGKPGDPDVLAGRKLPWRTAAEIIDWSLPCHSIFLSREEGRAVGVNRPLADATMARIAKGVKRYVIDAAKPFIVTCNHSGEGFRGQGLGEPFNTVAAARDAHGLVSPILTYAQQGGAVRDPIAPLNTVCASQKDQNAVIAPMLVGCGGRAGQSRPRSADEPTATGTAKADVCVVAAHLMTMRNAGKPFNGADEPTHTVTAGGAGLTLVAGTLVQTGYGEREGQEPRALDPSKPLGTVVASGKHAAVAAFLAQHNEGPRPGAPGRELSEPVSTITATGSQQALVASHILNMKGSQRASSGPDDPIPTICAGTMHATEVRAFLSKYYGPAIGQDAQDPLHTATTKARFGLVTVDIGGEPYIIADIGMRMLSPRELFRAQGFPDHYIIDRGLSVEPPAEGWGHEGPSEVITLTKTAQVRMCGNSVCPPLAQALVAANFKERGEDDVVPTRTQPVLPLFMEAAE